MEARYVSVNQLFGHGSTQYIIPLYQRRYVWTQENQWEQLWTDLRNTTIDPRNQLHFTGAILLRQHLSTFPGDIQKYDVIDGQQRLTTFQIILSSISTICHNRSDSPGYDELAKRVDLFIKNGTNHNPEDIYKILPPESQAKTSDRRAFTSLIDGKGVIGGGRIATAYDYFTGQITKYVGSGGISSKEKLASLLYTLLDSFGVIQILLNSHNEPAAKIFKSLNKGRTLLAEFDHLRNNLFLSVPEPDEGNIEDTWKELHKKYWIDFDNHYWEQEMKIGEETVKLSDLFFQHFLMAKMGKEIIEPRKLFDVYEIEYLGNLEEDREIKDHFNELKRYSDIHREMTDCKTLFGTRASKEMKFYRDLNVTYLPLKALKELNIHITYLHPFMLFILNELEVTDEVFAILRSYTIRNMLCEPQSNWNFSKVFTDVNRFFVQLNKFYGKYCFSSANLIRLLSNSISGDRKWPDDTDIRKALGGEWTKAVNLEKDGQNLIRYILYQINHRTSTGNPLAERTLIPYDGQFNLEHIMPRNWQKARDWSLPNNTSSEHAQARDAVLWNIGNLTILTPSHNSAVGDASYSRKCQSFSKNSNLMLNRRIPDQYPVSDGWDVTQILKRGQDLSESFCKIWRPANHFTKLYREPLFMSDAMIQSDNYVFLTDTRNEEIELFDITSYSTEVEGVTIRGNLTTLEKRYILFACPVSVRSNIKPTHITDPRPISENPRSIRRHTVSNKLLDRIQRQRTSIAVVTRRGSTLRGTVEDHDREAIYMKIDEQPVIVYRHGVRHIQERKD